ncbi:MAG: aconitate hydratase, partial [Armatimonadota bacterium]
PMALGLRAVLARSFARIHHANLINFGILPLLLPEGRAISQGDDLEIADARAGIEAGRPLLVRNLTADSEFEATYDLTPRQTSVLLAGGLLNYIKGGGR